MCVSIYLDGEKIDAVWQVKAQIGNPVWLPNVHVMTRDDVCLCGLDVEATAAANGLQIIGHDDVLWEYTMHRPPDGQQPGGVVAHGGEG